MKRILILVLLSLQTYFSFGQGNGWEWQNPLPQGNTMNDIHVFDNQHAIAVGEKGTVLKTEDGGQHWSITNSGTLRLLLSVCFINNQTGWAVGGYSATSPAPGSDGIILKTTDGGNSWQANPVGFTRNLRSVCFPSAQTGYICGDSGTILKTTDQGVSWQAQSSGIDKSIYSITFLDDLNGWAVGGQQTSGNGVILKTNDGGATWQSQTLNSAPYFLNAVQFVNSQNGWLVGGYGELFRTTDSGNTWVALQGSPARFYSIHFLNAAIGWGSGDSGKVYKTMNGGVSWQIQTQAGEWQDRILAIHFADGQTGFAVGEGGTTIKSVNGGAQWETQSSGSKEFMTDVHFSTPQKGWAVDVAGFLWKTVNGGNQWDRQLISNRSLSSIYFIDTLKGWTVGQGGKILTTNDGGSTWQSQSCGCSLDFVDARFVNNQKGWILARTPGFSTLIYATNNGGNSWTPLDFNPDLFPTAFFLLTAQVGWVVGQYGQIRKTMDGGLTWQTQSSGSVSHLSNVTFGDEQRGWISSASGVLKTTDGGNSWQLDGSITSLNKMFFINPQIGWTFGRFDNTDYGFYKTIDGGDSWHPQNFPKANVWAYTFVDSVNGWTVGGNGNILHTSTGGVTPIHKTLVSSPTFSIYPNPAEDYIQLATNHPILSTSITDALGRTVDICQGEPVDARLSISHLTPGLYTIRICTTEGTAVQRVVKK